MISNKRFLAIFASIFLLGSVPLLLSQPNGAASAGLSAGFMLPIEQFWQMAIFIGIGLYAAHLRSQQAMLLVPMAFILLFVVGMCIVFDAQSYPRMPVFLLGAVLVFALSFVVSGSEQVILGMIIAASFGFHFGGYYYGLVPDIASPLYFMIGNILALALIFCTSVSVGITFLKANRRARRSS